MILRVFLNSKVRDLQFDQLVCDYILFVQLLKNVFIIVSIEPSSRLSPGLVAQFLVI